MSNSDLKQRVQAIKTYLASHEDLLGSRYARDMVPHFYGIAKKYDRKLNVPQPSLRAIKDHLDNGYRHPFLIHAAEACIAVHKKDLACQQIGKDRDSIHEAALDVANKEVTRFRDALESQAFENALNNGAARKPSAPKRIRRTTSRRTTPFSGRLLTPFRAVAVGATALALTAASALSPDKKDDTAPESHIGEVAPELIAEMSEIFNENAPYIDTAEEVATPAVQLSIHDRIRDIQAGSDKPEAVGQLSDPLLNYIRNGVHLRKGVHRTLTDAEIGYLEMAEKAIAEQNTQALNVENAKRLKHKQDELLPINSDIYINLLFQESRLNPNTKAEIEGSNETAQGLNQMTDSTAKIYGVENRLDPKQSIYGGARKFADDYIASDGDYILALARYNGPKSLEYVEDQLSKRGYDGPVTGPLWYSFLYERNFLRSNANAAPSAWHNETLRHVQATYPGAHEYYKELAKYRLTYHDIYHNALSRQEERQEEVAEARYIETKAFRSNATAEAWGLAAGMSSAAIIEDELYDTPPEDDANNQADEQLATQEGPALRGAVTTSKLEPKGP